jgi:hypothetical protein
MIWLLAMISCKKAGAPQRVSTESVPQVESKPLPSGELSSKRYADSIYPFQTEIPEGWQGETAPKYGSLRLRLLHEETGTKVEAWFFREIVVEPAPREDCSWSFVDHGHYFDASSESSSLVATCYPTHPSEPYVFASFRYSNGGTWQLEIHSPPQALVRAKGLGEEIIASFDFEVGYKALSVE